MKNKRKGLLVVSMSAIIICILVSAVSPGWPANLDQRTLFSFRGDYVIHGFFPFVLTTGAAIALLRFRNHQSYLQCSIITPVGIVLMVTIPEILQLIVPWRVFNWKDMLAGVIGVVAALPLYSLALVIGSRGGSRR